LADGLTFICFIKITNQALDFPANLRQKLNIVFVRHAILYCMQWRSKGSKWGHTSWESWQNT